MKPFTGNRSAFAVALVCVAQFVIVLDVTVVTGALPALGRELGLGVDDLQWVVTAYVLAFGGFLVAGGRAADLVGAGRAFAIGLAGFAAASLACGLAPAGWVLIAARVLQGLAAALLTPRRAGPAQRGDRAGSRPAAGRGDLDGGGRRRRCVRMGAGRAAH